MIISRIEISNYKSFLATDPIPLSAGFNVIIGRNNAGKTALIEALRLFVPNAPHRSLANTATRRTPTAGTSRISTTFQIPRDEYREMVARLPDPPYVPVANLGDAVVAEARRWLKESWEVSDTISLQCVFEAGSLTGASIEGPLAGIDLQTGERHHGLRIAIPSFELISRDSFEDAQSFLPMQLGNMAQQEIYSFRAERLNLGQSEFGHDPVLEPNAANLARALNHLQSNTALHRRFNQLVHAIFPDVTQVTVRPVSDRLLEVVVWPVDPETEGEDLAIPLSASGTGIGQVLAMLYVVLTSEFARPILIDEPQSFLHPGAVRTLLEILRREARLEHQYILATHSPAALAALDAPTLLLVKKVNSESRVEILDWSQTQEARIALTEVGARPSDVFGADDVLWVEGPTEETCFPLILRRLGQEPLLGTAIVALRNTGDLQGRHADLALDVYQRLSRGGGVLQPALGFVFDREEKNDQKRAELGRRLGGRVYFLPRRMYENYLVDPDAITASVAPIAATIDGCDPGVTSELVATWVQDNRWREKYFPQVPTEPGRSPEFWLKNVHASRLLDDLFSELSDERLPYDKKAYGPLLTQWILDNRPEDLRELAEFLDSTLHDARRLSGTGGS